MLKILTIHGSPHKGQTYKETMEFLKELGNRNQIDVKHVFLFQECLELCRGCGVCVTHGEDRCPNKAGIQGIYAKMQDADAVIITTPVYALHVSALVKNFIERSSYIMHRPCYFGKWFMSISTQFISGDKDVAKYLANVMHFWGFNIIPSLRLTMAQEKDAIRKKITDAVNRFQAIESQARFPVPTWKDFMMFRFRRSAMFSKSYSDTFPRDVEYFGEKGWLNSPYYYNIRLNPLMKVAGWVFDTLGRKITKSDGRQDEKQNIKS